MQELTNILAAKRENDYEERKFFAAIQGIDLDSNGKNPQKEWEDLKARAFSGGKVKDSDDVTSLVGITAQQKGFGIGKGLEYSDGNKLKNPFA